MQLMKRGVLAILLLSLTACVGGVKDINSATIPVDSALLIVNSDFTFDGDKLERCNIGYYHMSDIPDDLKITAVETARLRVFQYTTPGKQKLTAIQCIENKGLWVKNRVRPIEPPLVVDVKPGTITYPGTLVVDWESEGFGALDLINTGGGLADDEGSLVIKREDRSAEIKALIEKENPELLKKFKFVTQKFEQNPNIIQ